MAIANDDFQTRVAQQQAGVRQRAQVAAAQRAARPPTPALGDITPAEAASFDAQSNGRFSAATGRPSIADGLPEVNDATMGEFQQARARAAAARTPTVQTLHPDQLSLHERNSFNAQSEGRFAAAHPAPGPLPASTPAAQVQVDPLSARAGYDPRTAAPHAAPHAAAGPAPAALGEGLEAAGSAAPSRLATAAERAGQVFARARPLTTLAGRAGAIAGVATEGMGVARTIADKQSSKADVAAQAARGAGRLAAAELGAEGGAALGAFGGPLAPITVPVGAVAGGLAGYFGADKLIRHFAGDDPAEAAAQRTEASLTPGKANFGNVQGGADTVRDSAAVARQQANDGITPVADRRGNPDEVLGTFNGRAITRAESDQRSGQLNAVSNPNRPALGEDVGPAPAAGGGFSTPSLGGGAQARAADLERSDTAAGRIYQRLIQDNTPTGKRVAAQFADAYLGSGTAERGQDASVGESAMGANATLQRGRESDAASLQGERIRGRNARAPQYVFQDDGSVASIADGVLSPVTTADGKPAKVSQTKGGALDAAQKREDIISAQVGKSEDYASPEEYQAARKKALQSLMAELGGGVNGG